MEALLVYPFGEGGGVREEGKIKCAHPPPPHAWVTDNTPKISRAPPTPPHPLSLTHLPYPHTHLPTDTPYHTLLPETGTRTGNLGLRWWRSIPLIHCSYCCVCWILQAFQAQGKGGCARAARWTKRNGVSAACPPAACQCPRGRWRVVGRLGGHESV